MAAVPDYREELSSQIPALQTLMALGYDYLTPVEALTLRDHKEHAVILTSVLERWLRDHNRFTHRGQTHAFTDSAIHEAIRKLTDEPYEGLVRTNEKLYERLTLGVSLPQTIDGDTRSFDLHYIDWQRPENNVYHVTDEFAVERRRSYQTRRPDIVCFVNGIPLVVIECKRPDLQTENGGLPYEEAVSQMLRNQGDDEIPHLFIYAQLLMAVSKNHARYAVTGAKKEFWAVWKEADPDAHEARTHTIINAPIREDPKSRLYDWRKAARRIRRDFDAQGERLPTEQDRAIVSLLDPARLLDLAYRFMVFDGGIKKIARHQQYYAVNTTLARVAHLNAQGERAGGVIWHTTGTGKSLTMVMLAKALTLHPAIPNPRVILVTDRVNLDDQIWTTFTACGKSVQRAASGRHLIELVRSEKADIIATVIDKFEMVAREKVQDDNPNVFVLVDESHRSQYGTIHSLMRQVFRRGCYIGFTGTPLTKREKNTAARFGSFIHKYTMREAVGDQAVVPLLYEGRIVDLSVDKAQVDRWFERITRDLTGDQKADLKRKMSRAEEISKVEQRIAEIAFDLSEHFRKNVQGTGFKAQLATSSKAVALRYKHYLDQWGVVSSAVVISPPDTREGHEDIDDTTVPEVETFWKQMMARYGSEDAYNREIIADFARADGVELLIVVDKLLVGFDEPRNTVLYIDKPLRDHAILQAIARVNRLAEGKDFGYIIDYRGVLGDLNQAMQTYDALADFDAADVAGTITDISAEIERLPALYSAVWAVFKTVNTADGEAMERFLEPEDRRQQFYDALDAYTRCLRVALSSVAFFEQTPEPQIATYKRDMKFFHNLRMAVKLRYAEAVDYREYEQKIRKLLHDHVGATGATPITNLVEIFDREAFDHEVARVTGAAARADTIAFRLKRTITERMEQDPVFYRKFSELVDETIDAYRQGRIEELEYLERMADALDQVREGRDRGLPPSLAHHQDAPAYYGVMRELLSDGELPDAVIADMAIRAERIIDTHKIRDWRHNPDIQNEIWNTLEDYLYDARAQYRIVLDGDTMDLIIAQVIEIAKKRA